MYTKPITVEYFITECGKTLSPIIKELANWRIEYRQSVYRSQPACALFASV